MTFNLGQVATLHLPSYLSASSKEELLSEIRAFPDNKPLYTNFPGDCFLQGDCIREVNLFDQSTQQQSSPSALILSSSCDIDLNNSDRALRHVVLAPILRIHKYTELLQSHGKSPQQVESAIDAIRSQEVFHMFHLPGSEPHGFREGFVLLDHLFSLQVTSETFEAFEKSFSLTQFGHYLLLVKISLHFSRLWESFDRQENAISDE